MGDQTTRDTVLIIEVTFSNADEVILKGIPPFGH